MFKDLFYRLYQNKSNMVHLTGYALLLLISAVGFLGYILPYGQMSLWGATVIFKLLGDLLRLDLSYLWGCYYVDTPTIQRVFSFHFLLPIIVVAVAGIHITHLHHFGSNGPTNTNWKSYGLPLTPYFIVKDITFIIVALTLLLTILLLIPHLSIDSTNSIPADPMVTPSHIVPEWYFLMYYAILRSVPNKELGCVAAGIPLVVLAIPTVSRIGQG